MCSVLQNIVLQRKHTVVTTEQKLHVIKRLDKGESVKLISDKLGVGKTTIKDWC